MKLNQATIGLVWISSILFVVFTVFMGFHTRLCGDDLFLLRNYLEKGYFSSVFSFQFTTRWSSMFLFNSIFWCYSNFLAVKWNLLFYYFLLFTSLIFALKYALNIAISRLTEIRISSKHGLLLSILFFSTLFFGSSDLIEVWFWVSATPVYLAPVICFIAGMSAVFDQRKSGWIYLVILLTFLYIGGAVENFVLICLSLLGGLLFLGLQKNSNSFFIEIRTKVILALLSLLCLFVVNLSKPAIVERKIKESGWVLIDFSEQMQILWSSITEAKNIFIVINLVLFAFLGSYYRTKGWHFKPVNKRKWIKRSLLLLLGIIILNFAPLVLTFHNLGPKRSWFPFNFFLISLLVIWAFYLGNQCNKRSRKFHQVFFTAALLQLLVLGFYVQKQVILAQRFSYQYDLRTERLLKLKKKGNRHPVAFTALPNSGILASAELADKESKMNQGLVVLLKLPFDIYLVDKDSITGKVNKGIQKISQQKLEDSLLQRK